MPQLEAIPAFQDNYIWAIHDGQSALIVDPGDATPILAWLAARRMHPDAVLITHHHADHCGGLPDLLHRFPGLPVYGPAALLAQGVNRPVGEGNRCDFPRLGAGFVVLEVPGHTRDHLAFVGEGWAFCGDTLFSCGCGRVFDGTAELLHASLQRLATLPPSTLLCCAHEYTLQNLEFALRVDPDNPALVSWAAQARQLRRRGLPTLPVRLDLELARNPFLRCGEAAIQSYVATELGRAADDPPARVFAGLRALKDQFR